MVADEAASEPLTTVAGRPAVRRRKTWNRELSSTVFIDPASAGCGLPAIAALKP